MVGHRAEVRPSLAGSPEIDENPYVSVAVEVEPARWRGVGHGNLHRITGPPFDDGGAWIERFHRLQGWREVEPRLRALGVGLSANLTEDQRRWYAEFVDANELGLALEMLADWLSAAETPIRDTDRTEMLALARSMGNEQRVERPMRLCPPAR
jgi:hypothetical protein